MQSLKVKTDAGYVQRRPALAAAARHRPATTRAVVAAATARPQQQQQQQQQQQREQPHKAQQPQQHVDRRKLLLLQVAGTTAAAAALAGSPAAIAAASAPAAARAPGDWTTPGLAAPEDPNAPKFFRTPSGVKVQVLAGGAGPAAQPGDTVLFDYVLRRANGYFIYATVEGASFQPKDVPVGPVSFRLGPEGGLIPGLSEVLVGMAPGGRVRALVPPELGYVSGAGAGGAPLGPQPPTFATKRQLANHQTEPLLFEVELLRVNEARR